jgi:hypothetical protein
MIQTGVSLNGTCQSHLSVQLTPTVHLIRTSDNSGIENNSSNQHAMNPDLFTWSSSPNYELTVYNEVTSMGNVLDIVHELGLAISGCATRRHDTNSAIVMTSAVLFPVVPFRGFPQPRPPSSRDQLEVGANWAHLCRNLCPTIHHTHHWLCSRLGFDHKGPSLNSSAEVQSFI